MPSSRLESGYSAVCKSPFEIGGLPYRHSNLLISVHLSNFVAYQGQISQRQRLRGPIVQSRTSNFPSQQQGACSDINSFRTCYSVQSCHGRHALRRCYLELNHPVLIHSKHCATFHCGTSQAVNCARNSNPEFCCQSPLAISESRRATYGGFRPRLRHSWLRLDSAPRRPHVPSTYICNNNECLCGADVLVIQLGWYAW